MGEVIWRHHDRTALPIAVAQEFARTWFNEHRAVNRLKGTWNNRSEYLGIFTLVDGSHEYELQGRNDGNWAVRRI